MIEKIVGGTRNDSCTSPLGSDMYLKETDAVKFLRNKHVYEIYWAISGSVGSQSCPSGIFSASGRSNGAGRLSPTVTTVPDGQ